MKYAISLVVLCANRKCNAEMMTDLQHSDNIYIVLCAFTFIVGPRPLIYPSPLYTNSVSSI